MGQNQRRLSVATAPAESQPAVAGVTGVRGRTLQAGLAYRYVNGRALSEMSVDVSLPPWTRLPHRTRPPDRPSRVRHGLDEVRGATCLGALKAAALAMGRFGGSSWVWLNLLAIPGWAVGRLTRATSGLVTAALVKNRVG